MTVAADDSVVNAVSGGVLKVRVESEVTTLRLWPLMTLLSRTADELYRLDCDGVLTTDTESTGRVSCLLLTRLYLYTGSYGVLYSCRT